MVLDGLLVHLKTSLFILVHERSSSMLYVDGIGMVIIGLWSSKSTFGANKGSLVGVSDHGPDDDCHHGNVLPRHVDQKDEQKC